MAIVASIGIGGRYGNSPMRHRNSNIETLSSYLISHGLIVSEVPKLSDIFIALDHSESDRLLLLERKKLGKFSVLFRSEPRCVLPAAYKTKTEDLYDTIISFGKPTSFERSSHWPQYWLKEELSEFARQLGIRATGGKELLTRRIAAKLDGISFAEPNGL